MEKPFDLKNLEERLKAKGLTAVEGLAEIVQSEVFAWAGESCAMHENVLVKTLGGAAVMTLGPLVKEQIDKIDKIPG